MYLEYMIKELKPGWSKKWKIENIQKSEDED